MKRLVTGLILGVFFFWLVCFAPQQVFLIVLIGVALLCYYEFLGIVAATFPQHDNLAKTFTGYVAGVVLLLLPLPQIGVFVVLFALLAFALSLRHERLDAVLPLSACSVFGLLYVFGSWRCALELRAISPWWLLFAAGVNWIGDSVAYYVGSNFGRHKLSPHISPGKTWEGTAGSLGALVRRRRRLSALPVPTDPRLAGRASVRRRQRRRPDRRSLRIGYQTRRGRQRLFQPSARPWRLAGPRRLLALLHPRRLWVAATGLVPEVAPASSF